MSKPSDTKPTYLTTDFGAPVPDNQNSLTAGPRGLSVALDGDTVLVGAYGEDDGGADTGA
ncbi:hypothetical protein ACFFH1_10365, partial [Pseudofulvimonas gallinarii]